MKKNKNEMANWLIFIIILMLISFSIIFYFRAPKAIKPDIKDNITHDTIIVN